MKTSSKENPQTLIKLTEEAKKESKLPGLGFMDSQKRGTKPLKKLRRAARLQTSQKKRCLLAAANKIRMCSRGKRERNKEGHAPFQVYFFHTYTNLHTLDINYTNCIYTNIMKPHPVLGKQDITHTNVSKFSFKL